MKRFIIILVLLSQPLYAHDDIKELRAVVEQLRQEISTTRQSEAFRRSRAGKFKLIRTEIDGLEKLDKLTPNQCAWILAAGKLAKKRDPVYRPFLTRLYALHWKHTKR